jgi:hypothetical protein
VSTVDPVGSTSGGREQSRSPDVVISWVLYGLQLAGEALLAPFWLMSVMMTDSCGSVADEPAVCDGKYFATFFAAFACVLVMAVVVTPVAIIVAGRRGKPRWPWPVLAIVLLIAATAGYVYAFTR